MLIQSDYQFVKCHVLKIRYKNINMWMKQRPLAQIIYCQSPSSHIHTPCVCETDVTCLHTSGLTVTVCGACACTCVDTTGQNMQLVQNWCHADLLQLRPKLTCGQSPEVQPISESCYSSNMEGGRFLLLITQQRGTVLDKKLTSMWQMFFVFF